jgi:hypothetical protein
MISNHERGLRLVAGLCGGAFVVVQSIGAIESPFAPFAVQLVVARQSKTKLAVGLIALGALLILSMEVLNNRHRRRSKASARRSPQRAGKVPSRAAGPLDHAAVIAAAAPAPAPGDTAGMPREAGVGAATGGAVISLVPRAPRAAAPIATSSSAAGIPAL